MTLLSDDVRGSAIKADDLADDLQSSAIKAGELETALAESDERLAQANRTITDLQRDLDERDAVIASQRERIAGLEALLAGSGVPAPVPPVTPTPDAQITEYPAAHVAPDGARWRFGAEVDERGRELMVDDNLQVGTAGVAYANIDGVLHHRNGRGQVYAHTSLGDVNTWRGYGWREASASVWPQADAPAVEPSPVTPAPGTVTDLYRGLPPVLRRGVNFERWTASKLFIGDDIADTELMRLKDAGFTFIRLFCGLDDSGWWQLTSPLTPASNAYLLPHFAFLKRCQSLGLATVWTFLGGTAGKVQPLYTDAAHAEGWAAKWREVAAHCKAIGLDPTLTVFETANEPVLSAASHADAQWRWQFVERPLIDGIRAGWDAPWISAHASANSAGNWNFIDARISQPPHILERIVYNVHYYERMVFTHQQSSWLTNPVFHQGLVHYPSDKGGNRAEHAAAFAKLAEWAHRNNVPVMCDELGATAAALLSERAQWARDVREECETRGIGWSWWCWDKFGKLVEGPARPLIPEMRDALLG